MVDAKPIGRRERPAKPALSRDGIVAAAVEVMAAEGLERVTMRRLARELDTGPASLYVYLRDTAELHAAVLDALLGGVAAVPGTDARRAVHDLVDAYLDVLQTHPGLARVALTTRPNGRNYLALIDGLLGLLRAQGVPDDRAAWLLDVVLLLVTALAAEHTTRADPPTTDDLRALLASAPAADHPHLAAVGVEQMLSGPGLARLHWFVDVLVNGALRTARPHDDTEGTS